MPHEAAVTWVLLVLTAALNVGIVTRFSLYY
jgi:hypothetical protein